MPQPREDPGDAGGGGGTEAAAASNRSTAQQLPLPASARPLRAHTPPNPPLATNASACAPLV